MEGGVLVEIGERDQVLNSPRHPYTRKLIAAVPALHPELHAPCADGELALRIEHLTKTYNVGGRLVPGAQGCLAATATGQDTGDCG